MWDLLTALRIANKELEVPDEWSLHLTETTEECENFQRLKTLAELMEVARLRG